MIKTNDEAERMYCPQAMHKGALDVFCLGSNCMAWREVDDKRGFCGLAGEPQSEKVKSFNGFVTAVAKAVKS